MRQVFFTELFRPNKYCYCEGSGEANTICFKVWNLGPTCRLDQRGRAARGANIEEGHVEWQRNTMKGERFFKTSYFRKFLLQNHGRQHTRTHAFTRHPRTARADESFSANEIPWFAYVTFFTSYRLKPAQGHKYWCSGHGLVQQFRNTL